MSSPNTVRPNPLAAILIYGTPSSPELTQASWFRAEDRQAARAAAEALKFSVIELQTDAERALAVGVNEGVLKGSGGRMIVGSVAREVYRRIEEYARRVAGAETVRPPEDAAALGTKASPEQNINTTPGASAFSAPGKSELPPAPKSWEALRVGARVLAAYWNEKKEFEGFWLATVKRIDAGEFTLEWFEAPEYPAFKMSPKNVALVHPEFRPLGK